MKNIFLEALQETVKVLFEIFLVLLAIGGIFLLLLSIAKIALSTSFNIPIKMFLSFLLIIIVIFVSELIVAFTKRKEEKARINRIRPKKK